MKIKAASLLLAIVASFACAVTMPAVAQSAATAASNPYYPHFVPNSQAFWDFSKNWTSIYGPAYRDTVEGLPGFLPCRGQYALCFSSGPKPLPCVQTPDGRFADCKCPVKTGINYVLMSGILNSAIYQQTVKVCGADGSGCAKTVNKAPVCTAINQGRLIPGADVVSTFNAGFASDLADLHSNASSKPGLTICPKANQPIGPYAGCMTAPCQVTKSGYAQCSCPVFWGIFQLTKAKAQCNLGDDLVWSASYDPAVDGPR